MRDFIPEIYRSLLRALRDNGFRSIRFCDLMTRTGKSTGRFAILRHDVDRLPWNSVEAARIEAEEGMLASYYFRVVPGAWDPEAIRAISAMGHECGYHYEDMNLAGGDVDLAYALFRRHLAQLRELTRVRTICMHGSPLSRWDNREVWKKYTYRDVGIVGEPYFDLDFNEVFYITDTGRTWNGSKVSVRDRVTTCFDIRIDSTKHLIEHIERGRIPERVMINTHPQRWCAGQIPWLRELLAQNVKNVAKRMIIARRIHATSASC